VYDFCSSEWSRADVGASRINIVRVLRHPGAAAAHCVPLLRAILLLGLTAAIVGVAADGQTPENPKSDKGTFLIARPVVADPLFARSTVLMLPIEGIRGYVGLIVNKPTKVKLAELFPHAKNLKKQDATAYFGGPVDIHGVSAIFRSPDAAKHALHIFADVYVTFDPKLIDGLVKKSKQPSELRIFLGRSQWGLSQLRNEVATGGWYSTRDNAVPIFTADPGKVWQTFFDRLSPRPYIDFRAPTRHRSARSTL
jgi:putative AlgH/UPF0301 family transcriptional regulator